MSEESHVADAEDQFIAYNVPPDFCRVGKDVVPFDIVHPMSVEKNNYAASVFSHSEPLLMVNSIIKGVRGNAGQGVLSGVSQQIGHVQLIEGAPTVFAEDRAISRHNDQCWMNVKVTG